jgi:hypothetical protein
MFCLLPPVVLYPRLPALSPNFPLSIQMRSIFYTVLSVHEDVDVQKKGTVLVTMGLQFGNNMRYLGYQFLYQFVKLCKSTMSRPAAVHHCIPPGIGGTVVSWFGNLLPQHARIRTRVHVGTHEENMTKLMSHGISTRVLPITDQDGTPDTQWHLEWLEIRKKIEARYATQKKRQKKKKNPNQQKQQAAASNNNTSFSAAALSSSFPSLDDESNNNENSNDGDSSDTDIISSSQAGNIIVPSPKDILMGRGKRTMTSPGNIRLYTMLDDNFERYETSARHLKSAIAKDMVDQVKAQGCRFLGQVDGFWIQVDDAKARNKVSHDFRTLRSSKKSNPGDSSINTCGSVKKETLNKRGRND